MKQETAATVRNFLKAFARKRVNLNKDPAGLAGGSASVSAPAFPDFYILLSLGSSCCWILGRFCPATTGAVISELWLISCVSLLIVAETGGWGMGYTKYVTQQTKFLSYAQV